MKNNLCILILSTCALLALSCNKFLDVKAENQVLQEDLFKDNTGFHVAVNGIYRILSQTELYGKNLSWGFISGLGGNYQVTTSLPGEVRYGASFDWEVSSVINATEQIWKTSYSALANINNVIQNIEPKDTSFFEHGSMEKNLIIGEMYGLRAMLHFDLVRIFCPAPITGFKGGAIPYVTHYPEYRPMRKPIDEVYTNIIADMEKAQSMLGPIDTSVDGLRSIMISMAGRIRQTGTWLNTRFGDFFNSRGERMNYFAASGMLARIHLYKMDYDKAYANAKIVYDFQKRNWFRWTASTYQGQISDVDYIYTKRPEELLLTFSNSKNYDNFEAATGGAVISNNAFMMNSMNILFQNDEDDFRLVGWYNRYGDQRYLTWVKPRGTSYNATQIIENQGRLLPVMRFSEMYHILIECLARRGEVETAVDILNDLRTNRGAKVKIAQTITTEDLLPILYNDIIRETLTEGQTFYMFKRLNKDIFYGATNRIMAPSDWYAPIPPSENAYQL